MLCRRQELGNRVSGLKQLFLSNCGQQGREHENRFGESPVRICGVWFLGVAGQERYVIAVPLQT